MIIGIGTVWEKSERLAVVVFENGSLVHLLLEPNVTQQAKQRIMSKSALIKNYKRTNRSIFPL